MCGFNSKWGYDTLTTHLRPLLIFLNVLSFIVGAILIIVGSQFLADLNSKEFEKFLKDNPNDKVDAEANYNVKLTFGFMIGMGALTMILNLLGFIAAIKESANLLKFYMMSDVFAFLVTLIGLILEVVFENQVNDILASVMEVQLRGYHLPPETPDSLTRLWNIKMERLSCCGWNGYEDFNNTLTGTLPEYCCVDQPTNCTVGHLREGGNTRPGCSPKASFLIPQHAEKIIAVALMVKNILGIVIAATIFKKTTEGDEEFWKWTREIRKREEKGKK